jgi:hypothetical protein
MKKLLIIITLCAYMGAGATTSINKDRWMEIDLFWFERTKMKESSEKFWDRMSPLFQDLSGEKGIIINLGWLMDFVLEWNGDLNSRIPLPDNMEIYPQFSDEGMLIGNSEDRIKQWKTRFDKAREAEIVTYEPWTYKDLKDFIVVFKNVAKKHGVSNLKVGTFVLGWANIYKGNSSAFMTKHPNAFFKILNRLTFDPTAILTADPVKYGAYPSGIPEGLSITEFFGNQWGNMSIKTGLDAIVIRDSALGGGIYSRTGPFGYAASENIAENQKFIEAGAALIRFVKKANPKSLVIGYSNAASAVADWRVNLFDLESIAKEGYLDAYIDQSWAGAWNEVGHRPSTFWNVLPLGWTYQLSYILLHAAVLSETPCKHYVLTETFDAWESWNIINGARERLRWGIWAYTHAAVKTPAGLKFPAGTYISWANQAKRLLDEDQIAFLTNETNAALRDLDNVQEINGPTLVYARSPLEWQMNHKPADLMKEWIDEQVGTLMKWNVPVLSSARIENLDKITSDMFIIQTPIHLKPQEMAYVDQVIASGKPVMIIGSPANGIDKSILKQAGLSTKDTVSDKIESDGSLNGKQGALYAGCENTFNIHQYHTKNVLAKQSDTQVIYSVSGSPALVQNKNLIIWDAPEISRNIPGRHGRGLVELDEIIGSVTPYAVLSKLVNRELNQSGKFNAVFTNARTPFWCGSWTNKQGELVVLAAELEEGLDHSDKGSVSARICFPAIYQGRTFIADQWGLTRYVAPDNSFNVTLRKGESRLFVIKKIEK